MENQKTNISKINSRADIDDKIINEIAKSLCQISYQYKNITYSSTGFFIKILSNNKKEFRFLVTCFDFSPKELENKNIELKKIEETNKKIKVRLSLDSKNRIIYEISDISLIQIKDEDKTIKDNFDFLTCDENYRYGYDQYKDRDVFTFEYLNGLSSNIGKIKEIDKNGEFNHNIQNGQVSSGFPIILLSDSRVIGVQKNFINCEKKYKRLHKGIFFGVIIDKLNDIINNSKNDSKKNRKKGNNYSEKKKNDEEEASEEESDEITKEKTESRKKKKKENKNGNNRNKNHRGEEKNESLIEESEIENNNEKMSKENKSKNLKNKEKINKEIKEKINRCNYIHAEVNIEKEKLNQAMPIISSYDAYCRSANRKIEKEEVELKNEEEIKMIDIEIDDEKIDFEYDHKFDEVGTHKIIYSFKQLKLTNINFIFSNCHLSNLESFNLNTEKLANVERMFFKSHLIKINLSNFYAKKLENMSYMFCECIFLEDVILSDFNAENVIDMSNMFKGCSALKKLDLSGFNTKNVKNLRSMFKNCSSLHDLNLSNFDTKNATDMSEMFEGCSSLTSIKLSDDFSAENVKSLRKMFYNCSSLKKLNFSKFNSKEVNDMSKMFSECSSLTRLVLSDFNIEKVTNMSQMFYNCSSLSYLELSNDNKQIPNIKVTRSTHYSKKSNRNIEMNQMFVGCSLKIKNLLTDYSIIEDALRKKNIKVNK